MVSFAHVAEAAAFYDATIKVVDDEGGCARGGSSKLEVGSVADGVGENTNRAGSLTLNGGDINGVVILLLGSR